MPALDPHLMSCMEVWGGNHAVEQGVVMPGLDLWVFSEPFEGNDQGGDVHYVSSCGTGRISRLVIADVSGHGAQVGRFALALRTLMRRFVNYLDQTRFVEALNRGLLTEDSGLFATSVAMTFFAPSSQLDLCNAGHPRPFWYRAEQRRWAILVAPEQQPRESEEVATHAATAGARSERNGVDQPSNLPLGVLEPTRYEQFGIKLGRGDLVLAYTDALVECRNASGEMLGETGLLAMVAQIDANRAESFVAELRSSLNAYRSGAAPDDDVTILLLRHNGSGKRAPFLERIWAALRFLGILGRNLVPVGDRPVIPWPEPSKTNILGAMSRRISEAWNGATPKPGA
jgi:sigma-B regulation protein RsbU (phosphoserine phosphatase)